jgi:hypothetical protein
VIRNAPLWVQLLCVWGAAVVLALLLLALDGWFSRPSKFYWLIPYPSGVRGWLGLVWGAFRARPLTASALLLVPTLAGLVTLLAVAARLAPLSARSLPRG